MIEHLPQSDITPSDLSKSEVSQTDSLQTGASFPMSEAFGGRRFYSYSHYFKTLMGGRVQKLSVDAGFSCPNRDGTLNRGGCTFCNNDAFNPSYCQPVKSITQQLDEGISFHQWRYRHACSYLAYFQAYSNTYAPLEVLRARYEEALSHPQVAGLIVGTRPDCVDEEKLDYIASLAHRHYVAVEYGIESCYDATLQAVHRGHTFATTRSAIMATAQRGIHCGGHLILGLPGETRAMMLASVDVLNSLPLSTVKFHQLQILKGSLMEQEYHEAGGFTFFTLEEYVSLIADMVERLRPDLVPERFAGEVPPRYQAAPERSWRRPNGKLVRNEEIPILVEHELERRNSWQGKYYTPANRDQ